MCIGHIVLKMLAAGNRIYPEVELEDCDNSGNFLYYNTATHFVVIIIIVHSCAEACVIEK